MLFITKIFFKVNKLYMLTVCNNTSKKTYMTIIVGILLSFKFQCLHL